MIFPIVKPLVVMLVKQGIDMLKRSLSAGAVLALAGCVVAPGYGAYDQGYYGAPAYETAPGYGYGYGYAPGAVDLSVGGYRDGYDRRRADPPPRDGGHSARADGQQRGGGPQDFRSPGHSGPGPQPARGEYDGRGRGGAPGAGGGQQGRHEDAGRGRNGPDGQGGYGR